MQNLRPALPRASALLLAAMAASPIALTGQTTGFNQTGAGPLDYDDPANWVGSAINGTWDSTLITTAAQTVTFDSNLVLTTGLNIAYTGNFDLTFRSDGVTARTIKLGGDVIINPASNRTINFGSTTAAQALDLDLGGNRVFTVANAKIVNFFNTISGGDFTVTGTGPTAVGGTFKLSRTAANAATSDITVANNATLQIDNSTNGFAGATRAASLTLVSGGKLSIRGNNVNTVEVITGALATDGGGSRQKSSTNAYHSVSLDAGTAHTLLQIGSLDRINNGTLLVRGDNLGVNTIASATAGSSNIQITGAAPAMIGGGGADGSTTISIIPWLVGGTNLTDSGSTLVTYSATKGLRPLDVNTEFASAFGGSATDNVRLTATTDTAISSDTTVNSLVLAGAGGSVSGSGTLTVTSGAVLMTRNTGASSSINVNLNFGSAQGVFGYIRGDVVNGAIAGTGGLVVHGNRSDEALQFLNTSSTYSGDTIILANALVAAGFLPSGSRSGDVYVYGNLQLNTAGFTGTINGLNGNGIVAYGNSVTSAITIGDNNANGTFTGNITGNSNLKVIKTGTGTQTFGGDSTYGRGTDVNAGTLLISNTTGSGTGTGAITVASGARFGGTGIATGAVTASAADSVIIAGGVGSLGTLNLSGGLVAANGATFHFDINGAAIDTINFGAGLVNIDGMATVNLTNLGTVQTGIAYSLLTGSGDWSGSSASFTFLTPAGYTLDTSYGSGLGYVFDTANHSLTVQFASSAIPEPSTFAAIAGLGALGMAALRRRRAT